MYILKVSVDLGVTYINADIPKSIESLKKIALKLENEGSVRWVIVDENDNPKYWCQYIEANLQVESDCVIATDDYYMTKLANQKGIKTLTTLDMLRQFGVENAEEKLASIQTEKVDMAKVLEKMDELISEGLIEVAKSNIDDSKVGKELFGEN